MKTVIIIIALFLFSQKTTFYENYEIRVSKMNLFILDKDTDYLERFKHYMSKKYTHMQISVCDNIDTAKILLHETVFDVVLFSAEFDNVKLEELSVSNSDIIFSYISDTNEIINGQDTIFKYLSVSI